MVPVASGFPEYSGTMIPEVWSSKILIKFYDYTVLGHISNTEYEGEIKEQGNVVHIRTTPTIIINDHSIGEEVDFQTPEPDVVDLMIDKGKAWGFLSDDIVKKQSDYEYVSDWTRDAGEQMAISIDRQVLADVYADAAPGNKGVTAGINSGSYNFGATGSPVALDKTNIIDYIIDMGSALKEYSVPDGAHSIVMPPWACGLIKKSDLKDASLTGDDRSTLRNGGRVGMIDKFTIYDSNLLSTVMDGGKQVTNMIFCQESALTFASQLIKNEGPMRHPSYFGDYYRGLQVYGYEVIKPEAMGHFYAYKA